MADHRRARPLRHHLADPRPDQPGRRGGGHGECAAAGRRPLVDRRDEAAAVRDLHHDHPECRRRRQGRVDGHAVQHRPAGHAWRDRSRRSPAHPRCTAEFGDLVVSSTGAKQRQEQRFDRYVADTSLTPTQDGRLDLTMDATVGGWKSASEISGGTPIAIGIQTMRAVGRINGVNRERVAGLLAAIGGSDRRAAPRHRDEARQVRSARPRHGRSCAGWSSSLQDMLTAVSSRRRWTGCRSRSPAWAGCR